MKWDRESFEEDRRRYQADLDRLVSAGFADGHPLIQRLRRRIAAVDLVLGVPSPEEGKIKNDHVG